MAFGNRCTPLIFAALFSTAALVPQIAAADTYPAQPVRLIIPFGAGGITDVAGRLVGQYLSEALKQQVVVENRPGAGGAIAAQTLVSAKPDGYTILLGTVGTQVVNKMLYSKLNYDPAAMTPVSLVSNSPYVLAVSEGVKAKDLPELVTQAKANPGKLNFGSAGNGSSPHLGIELFKLATGTDIVHVPFKSGAEAVNAAIGKQVDIVIDAIPVIQPQAKAGRLTVLGIAADKRNTAEPDVRTSVEQGIPAFQIGSWNALLAPAGTPADRVEILNRALTQVLARPEVVSRLAGMGIEPLPTGPAAYREHVARETEKWSKVIAAAGTRLD